jgi:hypothetical protein
MAGSSVMFCRDALQDGLQHAMMQALTNNDVCLLESIGKATLEIEDEATRSIKESQTIWSESSQRARQRALPAVGVAKGDDGNISLFRRNIQEDALSSCSSEWASGYEELATTATRDADPSPVTDDDGKLLHHSAETNALPADLPAAQDFGAPIRDHESNHYKSHRAGPD